MTAPGMLAPDAITIVDFCAADIAQFLDYWYRSPVAHFRALGVANERLPSERHMREMLMLNIERNSRLARSQQAIVSIAVQGRTVGFHELTGLGGHGEALMHAHIVEPAYRGMGIGLVSYVKAMQLFFARFDLAAIRFETPSANIGARRVKEKLGIAAHGSASIAMPMLDQRQPTLSYRVERGAMAAIEQRMHEAWRQRWPLARAGR